MVHRQDAASMTQTDTHAELAPPPAADPPPETALLALEAAPPPPDTPADPALEALEAAPAPPDTPAEATLDALDAAPAPPETPADTALEALEAAPPAPDKPADRALDAEEATPPPAAEVTWLMIEPAPDVAEPMMDATGIVSNRRNMRYKICSKRSEEIDRVGGCARDHKFRKTTIGMRFQG